MEMYIHLLLHTLTAGVAALTVALFAKIQKKSDHKVYTREGSS